MASPPPPSKSSTHGSAPVPPLAWTQTTSSPVVRDDMLQSVGNEEASSNRGQKRKAHDALSSSANEQDAQCMILELPGEVMTLIVSFQAHKDQISVATTCSDLLKAVEAFSERALEEMSRAADDTWEARIAEQSSIITEMPKPLELPHRYLIWKALRTHLYTLGGSGDCTGLHALPHENRLVSSGGDCIGCLWDLSTKQSVTIFDRSGLMTEHDECFVCGDHVVASFEGDIYVYSLNGDLIYLVEAPWECEYLQSLAVGQEKVFFKYITCGEDSISQLDLVTGNLRRSVITCELGEFSKKFDMFVCGDVLVVLRDCIVNFENDDESTEHLSGIYVFDLSDFSQKHFFHGEYHSMAKAFDDPTTIVAATRRTIDVLALEDGHLSRRLSIPRSQSSTCWYGSNDILLVYNSLAFVHKGRRDNTIKVYNIKDGELVHTYNLSACAVRAATDGRELFFGFNSLAEGGDNGPFIRAFRLLAN